MLVLSNCKKKPKEEPNTDPAAPVAYSDTASFVTQTWATLNGIVNPGNLLTTVSFEWGTDSLLSNQPILANPDTLSGNYAMRRTANLIRLTPNTTYYYRPKAVNSMGEAYGPIKEFTTLEVVEHKIPFHPDLTYGEINDNEGNVYKTIQIGEQTWMAQNLAVTEYNDGEPIPLVVNSSAWLSLDSDAYSWYGNVETKYGALYNWYAASSEKLCPAGWRVPTDEDWTKLTDYLGGTEVAGGKLKEATYMYWASPNLVVDGDYNSSGFTALGGGYRDYYGTYNSERKDGYWWTSSSSGSNRGVARRLYSDYTIIDEISTHKLTGASVRCIKEE